MIYIYSFFIIGQLLPKPRKVHPAIVEFFSRELTPKLAKEYPAMKNIPYAERNKEIKMSWQTIIFMNLSQSTFT